MSRRWCAAGIIFGFDNYLIVSLYNLTFNKGLQNSWNSLLLLPLSSPKLVQGGFHIPLPFHPPTLTHASLMHVMGGGGETYANMPFKIQNPGPYPWRSVWGKTWNYKTQTSPGD